MVGAVAVRLAVNRRARRIVLRIDAAAGEAVAVAPSRARLSDALAFAKARRGWIEARLAAAPAPWRLAPDQSLPALKRQARQAFLERLQHHCRALGVASPRLSLGDARTRWGSCAPPRRGRPGSIRLSWRLALAPSAVADYVIAHECAHLKEANHGPAFWRLVRGLVGDPAPHRRWLRAHGPRLHALEI
ncbi:MAG TPA: YgjP-like metallopeptidase domain-containing protein [Caulobacteraceae bacterium]|nr:YgjP-like metallopeptidase domain-containing protein [Caulobacteraceae bacterium]